MQLRKDKPPTDRDYYRKYTEPSYSPLDVCRRTLRHNFAELQKIMACIEDDDSFQKNEFFDCARALHNYVASVSSYLDHATKILAVAKNDEGLVRISELKNNILIQFIRGLRNFSQHHSFPAILSTVEFWEDSEGNLCTTGNRFVIKPEEFQKDEKFSATARTYIAKCGEYVDLKSALSEGQSLLEQFDKTL